MTGGDELAAAPGVAAPSATSRSAAAPVQYVVHVAGDDDIAYFGPVPADARDPLNTPVADLWVQTGELDVVDVAEVASGAVVNPWSLWLEPSDHGDDHAPRATGA